VPEIEEGECEAGCWCGSGRPYEDCHLGRASQSPITQQDYLELLQRNLDRKYCLHPDAGSAACKGGIVRAHTIQRNGGLNRIARDHHVYGFQADVSKLWTGVPVSQPKLLGIKQASTFTGFCGYHDSTTFEPIERHPFQSNEQHTFLAGYRALCKEQFSKATALENYAPFLRDSDKGKPEQAQRAIQAMVDGYEDGVKIGLEEVTHYKERYDNALTRGDFSASRYYVIRFAEIPEFMCSGATQPEFDFAGERLQDWESSREEGFLDYLTFTLTAVDSGGIAIFNWLDGAETVTAFIRSLKALSDAELPHALVRFVFEYFENTYMSPERWEHLDEDATESLLLRHWTGIRHDEECLVDDKVRVLSWTVVARETNAF